MVCDDEAYRIYFVVCAENQELLYYGELKK